jgi:hypothetical protein
MADVHMERVRQHEKWGVQNHPLGIWIAILGEEFGEACQQALRATFNDPRDGTSADPLQDLRTELVQVAAVAIQIIEHIDSLAESEAAP